MKSAKIYTTDRMFEKLKAIFENEKNFTPVLEEDKIIVNILKQVMANSEECDEKEAIEKDVISYNIDD